MQDPHWGQNVVGTKKQSAILPKVNRQQQPSKRTPRPSRASERHLLSRLLLISTICPLMKDMLGSLSLVSLGVVKDKCTANREDPAPKLIRQPTTISLFALSSFSRKACPLRHTLNGTIATRGAPRDAEQDGGPQSGNAYNQDKLFCCFQRRTERDYHLGRMNK